MNESAANPAAATGTAALPRTAPARVRLSARVGWQLSQVAADLVTLLVAAYASYGLYYFSGVGKGHYLPVVYNQLHVGFAAITVFALHGYGAYRREQGLLRIATVRRIVRAVFAGVLLTLGLSFLVRFPDTSRIAVLLLGPSAMLALVGQRFLLWRLQGWRRARQRRLTNVVIFGAGETGRLLAQHLLDEPQLELLPVGFLDDDTALRQAEVKVGPGLDGMRLPVFGGEESLSHTVHMTGAGAVFIAMPSAPAQRITHLIAYLESRDIPFFFVPSAGDLLFSTLRFGQVGGIPVFARRMPDASRFYGLLKRLIDIVGAATMLTLSAPVIALAALAVRLTSPGPVLFRQSRVGLGGEEFTIYKLRTMDAASPRYAPHPDTKADGRVTRIGSWLRRLSIDELPQLYNVLQGEMSLVGPRPEMPFVVEQYNPIQRQRLEVKPGLTGLWQISADRAFKIHDNIQYDLYYIERRSAGLDLAIMLLTPFVLLAKNRAM